MSRFNYPAAGEQPFRQAPDREANHQRVTHVGVTPVEVTYVEFAPEQATTIETSDIEAGTRSAAATTTTVPDIDTDLTLTFVEIEKANCDTNTLGFLNGLLCGFFVWNMKVFRDNGMSPSHALVLMVHIILLVVLKGGWITGHDKFVDQTRGLLCKLQKVKEQTVSRPRDGQRAFPATDGVAAQG